jgi:hypothetical protein
MLEGRGRPLGSSAMVFLLGGGEDRPLLPSGEKGPEGRMRGWIHLGAGAFALLGPLVFSERTPSQSL